MGDFFFRAILIFCGFFLSTACTKSSPKLEPVTKEESKTSSEVIPVSKDSFKPKLDILFIIDDSGSMATHQKNLAANVNLFAASIVQTKYLDYHIGVITSTAQGSYYSLGNCCGELVGTPNFVQRTTPNGLAVLAKNMIVGTAGDFSEKFFDPVYLALTVPNINMANKDFYRQDANLALIFITDTEDQSLQFDENSFYAFLSQLKGGLDKIYVAAAYIPDNEIATCSGESWELKDYDRLTNFFSMTSATTFSLCDMDFGDKLAEIGDKIAAQSQTMYLKQRPKEGTIKITLGGIEMPQDPKKGWSYNPVKVAIEFGSEIDWSLYPDGAFPQVDFEIMDLTPKPK